MKDLAKVHTRLLLKWLRKAHACGGTGYDPTNNHGSEILIAVLKAELAKREHIPNKQEAKILRQLKAKTKN